MTKFISTIAIAVFLESLVAVFEASKTDVRTMIYPTLLLFGGVALMVGLGVYQRLSATVEKDVKGAHGEAKESFRRRVHRHPADHGGRGTDPVLAPRAVRVVCPSPGANSLR